MSSSSLSNQSLGLVTNPKRKTSAGSQNTAHEETSTAGNGRKKYNVINEDVRKKIITKLTEEGANIKEVAIECGLKLSTCKAILQVYQKEGRIGKKATRDRKSKIVSTILIARIDPMNPTSSTITPYVHVSEAKTASKKSEDEQQLSVNELLKEAFKNAQDHMKSVIQVNAQEIFLGGGHNNTNNEVDDHGDGEDDDKVPGSLKRDLETAFLEAQRDAIKHLLKTNPLQDHQSQMQQKSQQLIQQFPPLDVKGIGESMQQHRSNSNHQRNSSANKNVRNVVPQQQHQQQQQPVVNMLKRNNNSNLSHNGMVNNSNAIPFENNNINNSSFYNNNYQIQQNSFNTCGCTNANTNSNNIVVSCLSCNSNAKQVQNNTIISQQQLPLQQQSQFSHVSQDQQKGSHNNHKQHQHLDNTIAGILGIQSQLNQTPSNFDSASISNPIIIANSIVSNINNNNTHGNALLTQSEDVAGDNNNNDDEGMNDIQEGSKKNSHKLKHSATHKGSIAKNHHNSKITRFTKNLNKVQVQQRQQQLQNNNNNNNNNNNVAATSYFLNSNASSSVPAAVPQSAGGQSGQQGMNVQQLTAPVIISNRQPAAINGQMNSQFGMPPQAQTQTQQQQQQQQPFSNTPSSSQGFPESMFNRLDQQQQSQQSYKNIWGDTGNNNNNNNTTNGNLNSTTAGFQISATTITNSMTTTAMAAATSTTSNNTNNNNNNTTPSYTFNQLYSPKQCAFQQQQQNQYSDSPSMSTMNASPAITPFLNPFTLNSPSLSSAQNSNNNYQNSFLSPLNIALNSPFQSTKSSHFSLNSTNSNPSYFQEDSIKMNFSKDATNSTRDKSLSLQQQQQQQQYQFY